MKLVTAVYHQVTAKTSLQIDPKKLPPTAILQLPVSPRKQNHTTKKRHRFEARATHHLGAVQIIKAVTSQKTFQFHFRQHRQVPPSFRIHLSRACF